MDDNQVKLTAAAARHAATTLINVWHQMGQQPDDYDTVHKAASYLLACSEQMP